MINEEILEVLSECRIQKDNAICYLISLFYGYKPDYIPDTFKQKMNTTGIYTEEKGSIKWNIPLFEGQQTAFSWVETEYVKLFESVGKATNKREAVSRMKTLFAKNPDIRKDEVIGATKMYLKNDAYPRLPHYFIEKGKGVDKTNDILSWIDKYRIAEEQSKGASAITNTMQ